MAKRGKSNLKKHRREVIGRPIRFRKYKQIYLIVCEDEKTEPSYFSSFKSQFPDATFYIECIGTGRDALGVVEQTLSARKLLEEKSNREVDFTWSVFDKDSADENETKTARYRKAFALAEAANINTAHSNEVFEVWLLLHFCDLDPNQAIPREEIYQRLENCIRAAKPEEEHDFQYRHGHTNILTKVMELGDEEAAIQRAKSLCNHFEQEDPLIANPCTHVYKLVQDLRDWIRFYNWEGE